MYNNYDILAVNENFERLRHWNNIKFYIWSALVWIYEFMSRQYIDCILRPNSTDLLVLVMMEVLIILLILFEKFYDICIYGYFWQFFCEKCVAI